MGVLTKNNDSNKGRFCKFKGITFHTGFLESEAWKVLTKSQINVFIYIWSCIQWTKIKRNKKKIWIASNNGYIEISMEKMRKKLGISKGTSTDATHKLITVGLICLTREGKNKVCHMYKILYSVVPPKEERWRKYPKQNWAHECPKSPNNLIGRKTQFKSHPKKVDRKSDNQSNKLDRIKSNGTIKYTEKAISDE
tara:strand:+ start:3041 stop:3625 length:585 start_codon:yes stop_codon:yes gene_type:complete